MNSAGRFLGNAPGLIGISSRGDNHAHAPAFKCFRLAEQADIGSGERKRISHAVKGYRLLVHASIDDGTRTGFAQRYIHRKSQYGARVELKLALPLRYQGHQTSIMRTRTHFGKEHIIALYE